MAPTIAQKVQDTFDLERLMLPLEKHRGECPVTFPILYSKDIWTNPKLVVIVLGAGKVELCVWSRSLCINKSLGKGSVMQAVYQAMVVRKCAVLLTNPNVNTWLDRRNQRVLRIPGNGSPEDHLHYLYRLFIEKGPAREIAIIAHSFGGVSTMSLLSRPDVAADLIGTGRLKSLTLTDSVHSSGMSLYNIAKSTKKWLAENAINWVRSRDPLGKVYQPQSFTQRQSAGTDDHASTNYTTIQLVWEWIDARMTKEALEPENTSDKSEKSENEAVNGENGVVKEKKRSTIAIDPEDPFANVSGLEHLESRTQPQRKPRRDKSDEKEEREKSKAVKKAKSEEKDDVESEKGKSEAKAEEKDSSEEKKPEAAPRKKKKTRKVDKTEERQDSEEHEEPKPEETKETVEDKEKSSEKSQSEDKPEVGSEEESSSAQQS